MNWRDCIRQNERLGIASRFDWPIGDGKPGFDCHDAFTFDDVTGALGWIGTWPGDYFLSFPVVRSLFGMGQQVTVGGLWSSALFVVLLALVLNTLRR